MTLIVVLFFQPFKNKQLIVNNEELVTMYFMLCNLCYIYAL